MAEIQTRDHWVQTEEGQLYAKAWVPDGCHDAESPAIVLLHDSLGCVELWRDFPARLSAVTGLRVVAYDRLGFGRSDPHPSTLSPLRFIQDEARGGFRSVTEALGLKRFIVFGHSVGGGMAVACAAAYPSDCTALIAESAQAFAEELTLQGIRQAKQAFSAPGQLQRLEKYHGTKAAWVLSAWIDSWLAPEFVAWNLDVDLKEVRCPTLALHGDHDEYGSLQHPERIAGLVAGPVTVRVLQSCGHAPHREQEGTVLAHLQAWLD